MGKADVEVAIVVVPFPAQGHLNQLLHLCRLLAHRGLSVHFVSSQTHTRQAKIRLHGWDPQSFPTLQFHSFPIPPFASPPPDPHSPLPFPSHFLPSFHSSLHIRPRLANLLRSLSTSSRRLVLVHDSLMPFAAHDASILPNAESFAFHSVSAFANLFFQWESRGVLAPRSSRLFPDLPVLSVDSCFTPEFLEFVRKQHRLTDVDTGRLFNTCREVEGKFLEMIEAEPFMSGKRAFAIGPLNPVDDRSRRTRHGCLAWLDEQPVGSVVYVSFGTTSTLCCRQIKELAAGLERSKQRFIWVLRDADRGDIFAQASEEKRGEGPKRCVERELLLDSLEQAVSGRKGVVVRGWAPQLDILSHPAAGAFLSHCGWNSCMESMSMGVPILTWPMHSDQPRNALMVTRVLRVGITMRDWSCRRELVTAVQIETAIRRLMSTEEGARVRARAKTIGVAARRSIQTGGCSYKELEAFISHITRP